MQDSTEHRILTLIRKADPAFVEMLYDLHADGLYGLACQILQDEDAARDVVQESFVKVWKHAQDYDPAKAKLFTWIYQIVRNTAIDHLRATERRTGREIQTATSDVPQVDHEAITPEHLDIPEHLQSLDPKYREVLIALFYRGMTQAEASEALEIPLGTVKTRLKIGLRELRKIFGPETLITITVFASWMT